jgi:hypothetical protein
VLFQPGAKLPDGGGVAAPGIGIADRHDKEFDKAIGDVIARATTTAGTIHRAAGIVGRLSWHSNDSSLLMPSARD